MGGAAALFSRASVRSHVPVRPHPPGAVALPHSLGAMLAASGSLWPAPPQLGGGSGVRRQPRRSRASVVPRAVVAIDPLQALGSDFLTFLLATVLVVPLFKAAKQSPVLGYLFTGLVLGQLG